MPFPIVKKGITLAEIPGKIAVFLEFGNCNNFCPECHSKELWESSEHHYFSTMGRADIVSYIKEQYSKGANAVAFLGGLNNSGVSIIELRQLFSQLFRMGMDIGLYDGCQGATVDDITCIFLDPKSDYECTLKWVKVGNYSPKYGGLDSPTTNQRFFEKRNPPNGGESYWEDRTYLFKEVKT